MGKALYNYNVYDIEKDKYILRDANINDVSTKIGIPKDKIATYASEKYLYKKRYSISRQKIASGEPVLKEIKQLTSKDKDFMKRWDAMRLEINPDARRG